MGSGRANNELTYSGKKPREKKRRIANHKKRLLALGVPEEKLVRMTSQELRQMLLRPERVRKQYAAKT